VKAAPKPLGKRELRRFLDGLSKEERVEQAVQLSHARSAACADESP